MVADIENEIFTAVAEPIQEEFGANVVSEYVRAPVAFPHVSIVETDNYEPRDKVDSSCKEKFVNLAYQVDVYSNKGVGSKAECKAISRKIREILVEKYGFRVNSYGVVPNLEDATIYRITARYVGQTDGRYVYGR